VLHGCRQLVSRDVRLSPCNERNPYIFFHSDEDKLIIIIKINLNLGNQKEVVDDVKSVWPG